MAAAIVSALERALVEAAAVLTERGLSFALVGGLAVSVRVEPRFTRDVDLVVAVADDRHAESVVSAVLGRGFQAVASVEHEATGRLATIRLLPPGEGPEGVVVDLLFASSGIEPELAAAAEPIEVFPGTVIPVATGAHLIALKLLSRTPDRPQDLVDLVALVSIATADELQQVGAALDLITVRGAHRGRDLRAALAELIPR